MRSPRVRENQAERAAEKWRPPQHGRTDTRWGRMRAAARRLLDLQAASIWRDLALDLQGVQGTLIDVGCGAQPYRALVPAQVRYLAIDTADAQRHFGYQTPDTVYYQGDTWPVEDATADLVLATETLEHVLEPARFLDEAHRCLRPGGRLLMTVPFAARWHYVPHDYWRYTPSGLKHLLEQAGFGQVRVYARGNALTVASYKAMALILLLLLSQSPWWWRAWPARLAGALCAPVLLALAAVGQLSLRGPGGDDCLGYTVSALRPPGAR